MVQHKLFTARRFRKAHRYGFTFFKLNAQINVRYESSQPKPGRRILRGIRGKVKGDLVNAIKKVGGQDDCRVVG